MENKVKIFEFKGIKAMVRKDTSDEFVVKEVMGGAYNKLNILKTDTVLDIGLNIGMFTCFALKRGASFVSSYEPEEQNFKLAKYNINLNGFKDKSKLNNKAVIGNNDKHRIFSINLKRNKGAHSLIEKRGRNAVFVECCNINEVLKEVKPSVVKIDCEGGEYEILKAVKSFKGIREMIMEFHHAHLNDKNYSKHKEIVALLEKHFKKVVYNNNPKGAWVTPIYCKK